MSEFRQDIVSGDWIIMAPERVRRPHQFLKKRSARKAGSLAACPFENLKKSGNWPPILIYPEAGLLAGLADRWEAVIVPNKYPALIHRPKCASTVFEGPYPVTDGIGHHDLLITRDHKKNFGFLSERDAVRVFSMFQARYKMLRADECIRYMSAFFNWGPTAGASLPHPHYQMLALPIIPPDIEHSLRGSGAYHRRHRRCVHCEMLRFERKAKRRIVSENAAAIAYAPFASRQPFEIRVFPKQHRPYFEQTPASDLRACAQLLQAVIRRVTRRLNDPDFNFFIHTAPVKEQVRYRYYHWHIEVFPKISIPGGFELSTGVDVNVVDPERAASMLRGGKS